MKNLTKHFQVMATVVLGAALGANANGQHITFDDFSSTSNLSLNGSAQALSTGDGNVIRLVGGQTPQAGSVFFNMPLNISDFSATFEFRISNAGGLPDGTGEPGGDGLVFVLQDQGPDALGGAGHDLGYGSISPSVAVEFDTWDNGGWIADINSNHAGILEDGSVDHSLVPWNFPISVAPQFDDGNKWYVWVDYDGTTLEMRASQNGIRPTDSIVETSFFLSSLMDPNGPQTAYVGFTAGQWNAWGDCDLIRWEFGPKDSILLLDSVQPGVAGMMNEISLKNATPLGQVFFAYGFAAGIHPLVTCPGLALDIHAPELAFAAAADNLGNIQVNRNVSPSAAGRTLHFQAVEVLSCRLSNAITQVIL
jgi:hypothetical protein